jgi:hypothetical protein
MDNMIAKCKMKLPFARLFQEHPNGCFLYMVNLIYQSRQGGDAYACTDKDILALITTKGGNQNDRH